MWGERRLVVVGTLVARVRGTGPFFRGMSHGVCLHTVHSNFVSTVPIILFSDVFLLVTCIPGVFNFS